MDDRGAAALHTYHEQTKHSLASLRRDPHVLDWDNMPRPFKVYPDVPGSPLPSELDASTRPVLATLADAAADGAAPLDLPAVARLLHFSAGVLRHRTYPGGEIFFRAAACTGALYHVELYLVCGDLPGLDAGVHHFGAHDHALRRLRAGDHRAVVRAATANEPAIAGAPAILAFTTTPWRNAWKYRTRAYRHAFWDVGTILANCLALAAGTRLGARVVLGFVDATIDRLLDVDGEREATIALVALGRAGDAAPVAPAPGSPERLGLATLPVSAHEIDYPPIRTAHAASALATPDDVIAWRRERPAADPIRPPAGPWRPLPSRPADAVPEPVERVILRRGSTRRFARTSITADDLGTILHVATRGVAADVAVTPTIYLLVHAVDGIPPGAWVHDRTQDAIGLLRPGTFRDEATQLGLGQALPGDAAVDLFWLVDLEPAFAALGGRGYRAAQLTAAIEGGRAYLAAYALGLGATGLTFFDDDVTAFFSPHAAAKSVMFLTAIGHPARRPS